MPLRNLFVLSALSLILLAGCTTSSYHPAPAIPVISCAPPSPAASSAKPSLKRLGYSVQVGAFANPVNATRLAALLESRGIDAYAFLHESGLYKVRFGDYPTHAAARNEAETLQTRRMIDSFFIVRPEDNAAERIFRDGRGDLRQELVATAQRFLGVPYNWGGTSVADGFDCSGLTMATYRLNGLNLPRTSRDQFCAGQPVDKSRLRKGDLVFFTATGGRAISHVGLYVGQGNFIHAPSRGKEVCVTPLADAYYQRNFIGARSYL